MYGDGMTTHLRKKLTGLLLLWVFMLISLAFMVFHDLETPFSVIVHTFQKEVAWTRAEPLTAEPPLITPAPVAEPEPVPQTPATPAQLPLLPQGTQNGKATFQKAEIISTPVPGIHLAENDILITIPYEGDVKAYTTFTVSAQRARSIDFHGTIKCPYQKQHYGAELPVRLLQMAQHKGYARISISGRSPVASFTETVHYTDTAIYIILTPVK